MKSNHLPAEQSASDRNSSGIAKHSTFAIVNDSRRPYSAPVLRTYGSVRQITLGGSPGASFDGQANRYPRGSGSDRSIKENIVRIGTHPWGIGLYLFDYKPEYRDENGSGRMFGVMADEVESVLPQAVGRHARGYKTVNYTMLGIAVAARASH